MNPEDMPETLEGVAIKIEDVSKDFESLLKPETLEALKTRAVKTLVHVENGESMVVVYHSLTYKSYNPGEKEKAYQKLAEGLDDLHTTLGIVGNLVMPSEIELHAQDLSLPKAVFCFPVILSKHYEEYKETFIKNKRASCVVEGGIGESV